MTVLCLEWAAAQPVPQWPEVTREMRPGSRWWWMGSAVDEANLQRNIAEYARCGIGTLEITPIYGVVGNEKKELNYLSADWLAALQTCQTTGEAQGVDIDMNGGTGWPFGGPWVKVADAAGKLVTKNQTLTADGQTQLVFDVKTPEGNATLNKVMAYRQDGDQEVQDVTAFVDGTTLKWQAPQGEWLLLAVYDGHTLQQVKRAAPGGEGYVLDHYNADAVARYLAHFDQRFVAESAQWPHSFFNDSYEVYGADWTPVMFEEFEKYRGYKLEEHMDQLLALGKRKDTGNQVLADYRQTLSDMLLNNFTRQWTDWAHSHGATTRNQGHGSPGNLIDFYAAVDIPEIESFGITDFKIRGLRTDPGFTSQNLSDLATLKYASSAAHVTGKPLVSSETFTWLSEHFRTSLSQMKPDLDQMFVAGVNHIFFHGTTYSPAEAAWPGWKFYASIDMSPTNSIWRDAPSFMAYVTRCQSFLQMGSPDNDVLVYAPFQDAMHKNTGANAARLQLFDINTLSQKMPSMVTTVKNLEAAGLDGDFISDALLLQTTVVDGCLQTEAGTRYKALVVPVSTNMPEATKAHLQTLEQQGATIVYKNDAATLSSLAQGEEMRLKMGLRLVRRKNDSGYHYFVTNLSKNHVEGMASLTVPFQSVALFDPMTGAVKQAYIKDGKVWISLKSGQSVILRTYDTAIALQQADVPMTEMDPIELSEMWSLSFTDSTYSAQPLAAAYGLRKPSTWEKLDAATATAMGTGIYETHFNVDAQLLSMSIEGMLLDLGDVRESARVYLNGEFVGCAWSAPYQVDVTGKVRSGLNTLRIEVTNLPANRIRQMDIDGVEWRIFKDVNILDVVNGSTSQSGITYQNWELVPSGLNSRVSLIPLRQRDTNLDARLTGFKLIGENYYPTYQLTAASGLPIRKLTVTDASGQTFTDCEVSEDNAHITVTGQSQGFIVLDAFDTEGVISVAFLQANGAYAKVREADFTKDEAPLCGWQVMTSKSAMNGFEGSYDWRRAPGKNTTKSALLSEGLWAQSETGAYYFYYPSAGMMGTADFLLQAASQPGDIGLVSYLVGNSTPVPYVAADSLVTTVQAADSLMTFELPSRSSYQVYRTFQQYRPQKSPSAIVTPLRPAETEGAYYTLQGLRTWQPKRGIYIRQGKKIIMK